MKNNRRNIHKTPFYFSEAALQEFTALINKMQFTPEAWFKCARYITRIIFEGIAEGKEVKILVDGKIHLINKVFLDQFKNNVR